MPEAVNEVGSRRKQVKLLRTLAQKKHSETKLRNCLCTPAPLLVIAGLCRKNIPGNAQCGSQLWFSETQKHALPSKKSLQEEAFGAWVNVACDDIRSREGMDQCLETVGLNDVFEELVSCCGV